MNNEIISHLIDIKKHIELDVVDVAKFHDSRDKGGFHSIPLLVFCYVDYLASIRYGRSKKLGEGTEKAIKYIENYFGEKYKEVSALIYCMWRHGTVHEHDPKVFKYKDKGLIWLENRSSKIENQKTHLNTFDIENNNNATMIKININKLANDLLVSTERLLEEVESNDGIYKKAQKNYLEMSSSEKINKKEKKLSKQAEKAVESTVGKLGRRNEEWEIIEIYS